MQVSVYVSASVALTGMSTAEEPGIVGSGRVPGMEAGRGCRCLFRRCSSEDREPGTGLRRGGGRWEGDKAKRASARNNERNVTA